MSNDPVLLNVVPVEKCTTAQLVADLEEIITRIEADPENHRGGKFVLIRLRDWECEDGLDDYHFAIDHSRMRNMDIVALLEAARHRLLCETFGTVFEKERA